MAHTMLWQLFVILGLHLLVFPTLVTGSLSNPGVSVSDAPYTRTIWNASYAPLPSTWLWTLSSPGLLTSVGPSSLGSGTQLLGGTKTSTITLTIVKTSVVAPSFLGIHITSVSTSSPSVPLTSSGHPSSDSLTTALPSTPNVPIHSPWPLTPGFSSSSAFDYSTWLTSVTSLTSGSSSLSATFTPTGSVSSSVYASNGASPFQTVITTTKTINGTAVVTRTVVTFLPSSTSSGSTVSTSYSESDITSTTTVNGSTAVTVIPPLTTEASSSSSSFSADFSSTVVVNGSTVVTVLPPLSTVASSSISGFDSPFSSTAIVNGSTLVTVFPPFTAGASLSSSGFFSTDISTAIVNGSTVVTVLPLPPTAAPSSSSGFLSADVPSTATINGSTTVIIVPSQISATRSTQTSLAATSSPLTGSTQLSLGTASVSSLGSIQTSSTGAPTSKSPATNLLTPTAPIPVSTSSQAAAGSSASSSSSSSSYSSTVAPIVITPVPIVLSSDEQSSTKDPKKTTGTHSDSVSEDEHGQRHTIHFPVLPGGCWFCPPGPPAFKLPELSIPGIYPPGKPPGPGWMSIPALTIDGEGNPKFQPEPEDVPSTPASTSATTTDHSTSTSSSGFTSPSEITTSSQESKSSASTSSTDSSSRSSESSFSFSETPSSSEWSTSSYMSSSSSALSRSCVTTTTQFCSTLTSFGIDASGSTTATRVASTCSPTIGCSVLASNTATATTARASSGCWEYDFKLDDQAFQGEDDQSFQVKNPEAGASGFSHIGGCTLTRKEFDPKRGASTVIPILIRIATWPAASSLATSSDATEWYAATMSSDTEGSCPTLTYKKFEDVEFLTASPVMTGVGGIPAIYSLDGDKPSVVVDHAYDIPLVMEFLESVMAAQSDLASFCDDFNAFFIAQDPSYDGLPRLQRLFNDAANAYWTDYAVDSVLNDVKAKLLANLGGLRGGEKGKKEVGSGNVTMSDSEKLQILNEIGAAIALINDDGVTSRFNMSNIAYRAVFMAIDQLGENPGCNAAPLPAPVSGSPGWANAYTNFMNSKLAQQNTAISEHIESIIATQGGWFTQTADEEGNLNLAGRGLKAFKVGYPSSMWTMSTAAMLNWDIEPSFYLLSPATCYTTPSIDIPGLLSSFSSLTAAESAEVSLTDLPLTSSTISCADGETTASCWEYYPLTGNSSSSRTLSSFASPSTPGIWSRSSSSSMLTPLPVPTPGSSLAPMTSSANFSMSTISSFVGSTSSSAASSSSLLSSDSSSGTTASSSESFSSASGISTTFETASGSSAPNSMSPSSSSVVSNSTTLTPSSSVTATGSSAASSSTSTETSSSEAMYSISTSSESSFSPGTATLTTSSKTSSEAASTTAGTPAATTSTGEINCNNFEQGSPQWNFDLDGAYRAIDWVCAGWAFLTDKRGQQFSDQWGEAYENPIAIDIEHWGDGNDTSDGTRPCWYEESEHRSNHDYHSMCKDTIKSVVDSCNTASNNLYWWKSGGLVVNDCWLFKIERGTFEAVPAGSSHNDAAAFGDPIPTDPDYRTDSTCDKWEDCGKCPVEHAQRKCDDHYYGVKYCTCKDPENLEPDPSIAPPPKTTAPPGSNDYTKLSCLNSEQGNPMESFDLNIAKKAIDFVCKTWYDAEATQDFKNYFPLEYGSSLENPLHLRISKNNEGGSCLDLYTDRDLALSTCQNDFNYLLNTCDTSSNGFYWWKSGGTLIKDCYEWELVRGEWNTKLEEGYSRNNAKDADDLTSDDYRPDSSCSVWQDCPKCPDDGWQRKCIPDEKRAESGACLCHDPSSGSASMDTVSTGLNASAASLHARSNFTSVNSLAPVAHVGSYAAKITSDSLQCINAEQGSPRLNFELTGANAAIEYACHKWADSVFKYSMLEEVWSAPYEDPIHLEIIYLGDRNRAAARQVKGRRDQPYCSNLIMSPDDFYGRCTANLRYIVDNCNTASNGHYWWKSGGVNINQCWRWSITRGLFARLPVGYVHNDAVGADDYSGVPEYHEYRPDRWCEDWQECPKCPLQGAQRKCRGDESHGPSYCICKA